MSHKVLLVDDEPHVLAALKRALRKEPYEVLTAGSGREGLALLSATEIAAVVADHEMPGMSGTEFLSQVHKFYPDTLRFMLTGKASLDVVIDAVNVGAVHRFFTKPCNKIDLAITIRQALEQKDLIEEANQKLSRKNEEIQRFYHTLCHELKTPLTSAREFLTIMLDGLAGPLTEDQRQYLQIAKDSCDQIKLFLNDLLDVTRLETGKLSIERRRTSIADLVRKVIISMSPAAQEKRIRLRHHIQPDQPDVFIDENRIVQVLTNLLNNALKFTPEEGQVKVRISHNRQSPEFVTVAVCDTGPGIEKNHIERIFDRLYQVEGNDHTSREGLGLGLYICKELVQLHGGEFQVESNPGEGSTFSFTVPVREMGESVVPKAGMIEGRPGTG